MELDKQVEKTTMETSDSLDIKDDEEETANSPIINEIEEMDESENPESDDAPAADKEQTYGCKLCGDSYFDTLQLCKEHLHEFHKIKIGVAANEFIKFSENCLPIAADASNDADENSNDADENSNHADDNSNDIEENSNHSKESADQSEENIVSVKISDLSDEKPIKESVAGEISALSGKISVFSGEKSNKDGEKSPARPSEKSDAATVEVITLEDTPKKNGETSDEGVTPVKRVLGRKGFSCKICGVNYFKSRKILLAHIRKAHNLSFQEYLRNNFKGVNNTERQLFQRSPAKKPVTPEKTVKCELCSQRFRNSLELIQHNATAHEVLGLKRKRKEIEKFQISSFQITCEICGKNFESKKYYQLHVESHNKVNLEGEDESPSKLVQHAFPCRICGTSFDTQIGIKKHIPLHEPLPNNVRKALITGKPFPHKKCHYCQKSFFNNQEFITHVQEHEALEPEVSIVCDVDTPIQEPVGQYQLEHSLQLQQQQRLLQLQQQQQITQHPLPIPENLFQQQIKILKVQPQTPSPKTQSPQNLKKIISFGANGKRVINKKCEYCGKICTNYYQYHKHVETHQNIPATKLPKVVIKSNAANGQNIIRCNDCSGEFMNNNDFNKHMLVAKPYNPVLCSVCKLPCQNECSMVQHTIAMHPTSITLNKRKYETKTNSTVKKARASTSFLGNQYLANQMNMEWSPYDTLNNPLAGPSYGIPPGLNVEVKKKSNDQPQMLGGIRLPKGLEVSLKGVRIPQGLTVSVPDGVRIPAGLQISPINIQKKVVQNLVRPATVKNVIRPTVGGLQVVRPMVTQNITRPVGAQNAARSVSAQNAARSVSAQNVARRISAQNVARPISAQNVARPIGTLNVARPISAQNVARPVSTQNLIKPVTIQNVVRQVSIRKEIPSAILPKKVSLKKEQEEVIIPDFLDDD